LQFAGQARIELDERGPDEDSGKAARVPRFGSRASILSIAAREAAHGVVAQQRSRRQEHA
jgi:hypothetical protein